MMLAQAKKRVVGTPSVWKNLIWSFLTKTKGWVQIIKMEI